MKRYKRVITTAITAAMAMACVNMSAGAAFAQTGQFETGTYGAAVAEDIQLASADDYAPITEESVDCSIAASGQEVRYSFTPETSGYYEISSSQSVTRRYMTGILYDNDMTVLCSKRGERVKDDKYSMFNFKIVYYLEAGKTYAIGAKYTRKDTGSFKLRVKAMPEVTNVQITPVTSEILQGSPNSLLDVNVVMTYSGGTSRKTTINKNSMTIDGKKYSVWVKDAKGSYTGSDQSGKTAQYVSMDKLPAGTYTVEIADYVENLTKPGKDTKLITSYTVKVLAAAEYFESKQEISESEKKTFDLTSEGNVYYKFTPANSSMYIFDGDYTSIKVYDESFNEVEKDTDNRYLLEKGKVYYVSPKADSENTAIQAKECSVPVSAVITSGSYAWVAGAKTDFASNMNVDVTYNNGSKETVKLDSYICDAFGNYYKLYYAAKGEAWDANECSTVDGLAAGTYTISIVYVDQDTDVETKLGSTEIEVRNISDMDIPELTTGKVTITSGENEYTRNYYKFIPEKNGTLKVDESELYYDVYELTSQGLTEVTGYLKKDGMYYVGFYDGVYDVDKDEKVYTVETNVIMLREIKSASVVPSKTAFVKTDFEDDYYFNDYYIDGMKLKLVYDDDTEETVTFSNSTVEYTQDGDALNVVFKENGEEIASGDSLPLGKVTVAVQNKEEDIASYDIQIKDIDTAADGDLVKGTNHVSIAEDATGWYIFRPETTDVYSMNPCGENTSISVKKYNGNDGDYVLRKIDFTEGAGMVKAALTAGETYYLNLINGIDKGDGDYADEWDMTVSAYKESGEEKITVSGLEIVDYDRLILGSEPSGGLQGARIKVTYSNGVSEILEDYYELSNGESLEYSWTDDGKGNSILSVSVDGVTASKRVSRVDVSGAKELKYYFGVSFENISADDTQNSYIFKTEITQDGYYGKSFDGNGNVAIDVYTEDGQQMYFADDDESSVYLEKGQVCYVLVRKASVNTSGIAKFGLVEELDWRLEKEPGCTTKGRYIRDNEDGSSEVREIPATGHSFTHYVQSSDATCTKNATQTAQCDNGCGAEDIIEIPGSMKEHEYGDHWTVDQCASEYFDGYKYKTCKVCGAESPRTIIYKFDKIKLVPKRCYFNGTARKPAVVLLDSQGNRISSANYKVDYYDNVRPGHATCRVEFKGDYEGIIETDYFIDVDSVKKLKTEKTSKGITVSWDKYSNITGYVIYRKVNNDRYQLVKVIQSPSITKYKDVTARKDGYSYTYRVVPYKAYTMEKVIYTGKIARTSPCIYVSATALSSVRNTKAKTAVVNWKKNKNVNGYMIQYADNSNFRNAKSVKIKGNKFDKKTLTNLRKGKTYYVRISCYKTVKGVNYYSSWSAVKTVKIKK